jgi:hypothetical protein
LPEWPPLRDPVVAPFFRNFPEAVYPANLCSFSGYVEFVDGYGGWRCCIQRPLVVQYGGFSVPVQRFSAAWVMVKTRNPEFCSPGD